MTVRITHEPLYIVSDLLSPGVHVAVSVESDTVLDKRGRLVSLATEGIFFAWSSEWFGTREGAEAANLARQERLTAPKFPTLPPAPEPPFLRQLLSTTAEMSMRLDRLEEEVARLQRSKEPL